MKQAIIVVAALSALAMSVFGRLQYERKLKRNR
jgi:hypothetical protein